MDNLELYTSGNYIAKHPDWHAADAPFKAQEILPLALSAFNMANAKEVFRIADVGGGTGQFLSLLSDALQKQVKETSVESTLIEISIDAISIAKQQHPDLQIVNELLSTSHGPFDAICFIDVLEHVENPWELLRISRQVSQFLLVRQPLLGNFSRFRHNDYAAQRANWGHISCYNYFSFLDMSEACGWIPVCARLLAPWELALANGRATSFKRWMTRLSRTYSSFFIDGFYLNACFVRDSKV